MFSITEQVYVAKSRLPDYASYQEISHELNIINTNLTLNREFHIKSTFLYFENSCGTKRGKSICIFDKALVT